MQTTCLLCWNCRNWNHFSHLWCTSDTMPLFSLVPHSHASAAPDTHPHPHVPGQLTPSTFPVCPWLLASCNRSGTGDHLGVCTVLCKQGYRAHGWLGRVAAKRWCHACSVSCEQRYQPHACPTHSRILCYSTSSWRLGAVSRACRAEGMAADISRLVAPPPQRPLLQTHTAGPPSAHLLDGRVPRRVLLHPPQVLGVLARANPPGAAHKGTMGGHHGPLAAERAAAWVGRRALGPAVAHACAGPTAQTASPLPFPRRTLQTPRRA